MTDLALAPAVPAWFRRRHMLWSAEADRALLSLHDAGAARDEITRTLGCEWPGCAQRLQQIDLDYRSAFGHVPVALVHSAKWLTALTWMGFDDRSIAKALKIGPGLATRLRLLLGWRSLSLSERAIEPRKNWERRLPSRPRPATGSFEPLRGAPMRPPMACDWGYGGLMLPLETEVALLYGGRRYSDAPIARIALGGRQANPPAWLPSCSSLGDVR